ncbi:conserved Plasmodium protein, unknown function [Plasmodium gallinaceum]|uniref:Uncharacterized protein n=1 Tax=Plasmodium gallinaceum TaxID=5849 RepID=A0A1J1GUS3_PLAGA|nr:conserved Plasmodium protein, unknown function [Plasmodium gallinaceum]CRG96263.1 conserved Plasmodium protein, unknown function [Plasmodium gallinaceum]
MPSGSFFFKVFICGSPFCVLFFNEINRIRKFRENERLNKSLFLKNFDKNIIKNEENNEKLKKHSLFINDENENEALHYFYGKAWGYTTDYEIDLSLNTGDLIFIKHDLDYINFFKKILLKINRYLQSNDNYDEIGIIIKKHNISYVYIQNILNKKEKLMRYSYFLQKYKPSVVSLRRLLCNDEDIKKKLHENILENIKRNEINKYSIFFNILYNILKKKKKINKELSKNDCLCDEYICKKINSNIEVSNLINMFLFRSFNLFFYFMTYINEENLKRESHEKNVLLKNINSNNTILLNNSRLCKSFLHFYELPLNSLTQFPFIKKDYELMKKNNFIYEKPNRSVQKEIEKFISLLIENEHTLIDSFEYINKTLKKEKKEEKEINKYKNSIYSNYFTDNLRFYFESFFELKKFSLANYHVYEIYKSTHLLPSIKNYNSLSLFLCLNNLCKPLNPHNLLHDTFSIPKLSNIFHVRQEEDEKLQKYFYQFNKVPKS